MQINISVYEAFKSRVDHPTFVFLWEIQQTRGKGSRHKWYLCCNLEGRLKTKFGPLCLYSFIKNLLDYRGLSAKMRFVSWFTLLLNPLYIYIPNINMYICIIYLFETIVSKVRPSAYLSFLIRNILSDISLWIHLLYFQWHNYVLEDHTQEYL